MKRIELANSDLVALVDDGDFDLVAPYTWKAVTGTSGINYALTYANSQTLFMHVMILRPASGLLSDHINFNGLDNRRSNLRAVTPRQNTLHSRLYKSNKSGYRGVYLNEHGKWIAQISDHGKTTRIGQFTDVLEAALAFDRAAYAARGDDAQLNFPHLIESEAAA